MILCKKCWTEYEPNKTVSDDCPHLNEPWTYVSGQAIPRRLLAPACTCADHL